MFVSEKQPWKLTKESLKVSKRIEKVNYKMHFHSRSLYSETSESKRRKEGEKYKEKNKITVKTKKKEVHAGRRRRRRKERW